jgi:hypothetical protein
VVVFLLDSIVFARKDMLALQVLAFFGIAFLFYGNAFNVTSWAMIFSSIFLALFPTIRRINAAA